MVETEIIYQRFYRKYLIWLSQDKSFDLKIPSSTIKCLDFLFDHFSDLVLDFSNINLMFISQYSKNDKLYIKRTNKTVYLLNIEYNETHEFKQLCSLVLNDMYDIKIEPNNICILN